MSRRLALLALTSTVALAQRPDTAATVFGLEINPVAQTLELDLEVELGFPLGRRIGMVTLDCATGDAPQVNALKQTGMDRYEPDGAATTALLAGGAVKPASAGVTVRGPRGVLSFFCRDHRLVTDFSRLAADPDAQFSVNGSNPSFDLGQTAFTRSLTVRYPLVFTDVPANLLRASGVRLTLGSTAGFKGTTLTVQDISFDAVASGPKEAVFLLDDRKRVLIPLKFAGNASGIDAVIGRAVGPTLVVYYAPDYTGTTGWQQTTIDFTRSVIWTQPVPRPTFPVSK